MSKTLDGLQVTQSENGVQLSCPDLPVILVVPNPNDQYGWRSWVALGFPDDGWMASFDNGYMGCETAAFTMSGCVKKARKRLARIAEVQALRKIEVRL